MFQKERRHVKFPQLHYHFKFHLAKSDEAHLTKGCVWQIWWSEKCGFYGLVCLWLQKMWTIHHQRVAQTTVEAGSIILTSLPTI